MWVLARRIKWEQEGKMAVVVLIQTSKSHTLLILKSSLTPTGPSSFPRSSLLLRFSPTECPLGRRGTEWLVRLVVPLFSSSLCLLALHCSPGVREGDTPAMPIGSGGDIRQASSISLQAGFPWQPSSSGQSYRNQIPALLLQGNFRGIPWS